MNFMEKNIAVQNPLIDRRVAVDISKGINGDPFSVLGVHPDGTGVIVRAFVPGAEAVDLVDAETDSAIAPLEPVGVDGVFAVRLKAHPGAYNLRARRGEDIWTFMDAYAFPPVIGPQDEVGSCRV